MSNGIGAGHHEEFSKIWAAIKTDQDEYHKEEEEEEALAELELEKEGVDVDEALAEDAEEEKKSG